MTSGQNLVVLSIHFSIPLPLSSQGILKGEELKQYLLEKLDWEKSVQGPGSKDKGPVQTKDCLWTVKVVKY